MNYQTGKRPRVPDPDGNPFLGETKGRLFFLLMGALSLGVGGFIMIGPFIIEARGRNTWGVIILCSVFGFGMLLGGVWFCYASQTAYAWNEKFLCVRTLFTKKVVEWSQVNRFEFDNDRALRLWWGNSKRLKLQTIFLNDAQGIIDFTLNRLDHLALELIPEIAPGETLELPVKHAGLRLATIILGSDFVSFRKWTGKKSTVFFSEVKVIYREFTYHNGMRVGEWVVLNDGAKDRVTIWKGCRHYDALVRHLRTKLSHATWIDVEASQKDPSIEVQLRLKQRRIQKLDEFLKLGRVLYPICFVVLYGPIVLHAYKAYCSNRDMFEALVVGGSFFLLYALMTFGVLWVVSSDRKKVVREINEMIDTARTTNDRSNSKSI